MHLAAELVVVLRVLQCRVEEVCPWSSQLSLSDDLSDTKQGLLLVVRPPDGLVAARVGPAVHSLQAYRAAMAKDRLVGLDGRPQSWQGGGGGKGGGGGTAGGGRPL